MSWWLKFYLSYRIGVEKRRLESLCVLLLVSHFITIKLPTQMAKPGTKIWKVK